MSAHQLVHLQRRLRLGIRDAILLAILSLSASYCRGADCEGYTTFYGVHLYYETKSTLVNWNIRLGDNPPPPGDYVLTNASNTLFQFPFSVGSSGQISAGGSRTTQFHVPWPDYGGSGSWDYNFVVRDTSGNILPNISASGGRSFSWFFDFNVVHPLPGIGVVLNLPVTISGQRDCACSTNCTPGITSTEIGSIKVTVDLGRIQGGGARAALLLYADSPAGSLSTRSALTVTNAPGVQTYRDTAIRQVLAPEAFADVVPLLSGGIEVGFQLKLYERGSATGNGPPYVASGNPFKTVTVENRDSSPFTLSRLRVTEVAGQTTVITDYEWSEGTKSWSLTKTSSVGTETIVGSIVNGDRTSTRIIKDAQGVPNLHTVTTYHLFPWGEEKIREVADPNGVNAITDFQYKQTTGSGYGRLQLTKWPNGFWQYLEYDSGGRISKQSEPFGDTAPPANGAAPQGSLRVIETIYGPSYWGSLSSAAEERVESFGGTSNVVARRRLFRAKDATTGQISTTEVRFRNPVTSPPNLSDPGNLATVTVTNAPVGPFASEVVSIDRPDGTLELYDYSTPSGVGKRTVASVGAPNAGKTAIIDGTRTTTDVDAAGNIMIRTIDDISGGTATTISIATTTSVDGFGRPTVVTYNDLTTELTSYGCCGIESRTDRLGVTTTYTNDPISRLVTSETRAGVTKIFKYDAAGNQIKVQRRGTDSSEMSLQTKTYNLAGQLDSITDGLTRVTKVSESGSSKTTTFAYGTADSATRVETRYFDGQLKSVSGSGAYPLSYSYGYDATKGSWRKEIKLGELGDVSQWSKTYSDGFGREYLIEAADGGITTRIFNQKGQLTRETDPDQVSTLYSYNARGEREQTALQVRDVAVPISDTINTAQDRIRKTVRSTATRESKLVIRESIYAFVADGSAGSLIQQVT